MDATSIVLLLSLISEGIGVAKPLLDLVKRVEAGEAITEADIVAGRAKVKESVAGWDEAVGSTVVDEATKTKG